jgi:TatD DNase family protein
MDLIDTHAHLENVDNLDEALSKAEKVGVIAVIAMGSDYKTNKWVLEESFKHGTDRLKIHQSLGLHPWNLELSRVDVSLRLIEENINKVVALGEIGLDYWYRGVRKDIKKKEQQKELFRRLLELAKNENKPVSIHSRGAWADCVNAAIEIGVMKAVFHWFSGPLDVLEKLLDYGYYISATPAASYSKEHRKAIENTPLDSLLLETDSPVAYKGETSDPSHILKSLLAVAEIKGEKEETIAERTTENARSIFKI